MWAEMLVRLLKFVREKNDFRYEERLENQLCDEQWGSSHDVEDVLQSHAIVDFQGF